MDDFVQRNLRRSRETATSLGLDTGALAGEKFLLDDRSLAASAADKAENFRREKELAGIDRRKLSGMDAVNYDTVAYLHNVEAEADRQFNYGGSGSGAPYILSQLTGAYAQVPDFLDTQHAIANRDDAEAYLARMSAFAKAMDQESAQVDHDAGLGVIPPDFVIDVTLKQMQVSPTLPPTRRRWSPPWRAAPGRRGSTATGPGGPARSTRAKSCRRCRGKWRCYAAFGPAPRMRRPCAACPGARPTTVSL